ncbi:carboxypeptidase-like regulatory domain-containing protein [Psychroserpens sp. SPM9]|uniref:carboxypeptidase-like regulatory domain-containing protein n=1 Tax=Psychroserpens sp. SPM9 TaxID=2975598 RepID=UPI0021A6C040|nr:carboxypeptidase-like regulatory domain-containing protein [Psychroserpens sp. SPM9]MDG5491757.1 carboxypeptidase-like regulatory domain-containing protein [Psychroserpens sp. SPM9]
MRTAIHINIPNPCHEDWNAMTPQEKGRHCASCQKTVFDFTLATDEQIVKTFLSEDKLCGRFKSTQLNRELVRNRKEKNNYLSYVASTLFAFLSLGTQEVLAQGKPKIVMTNTSQLDTIRGKIAVSVLNEKIVKGSVIDAENGLAISGVNVVIKGTAQGTITDHNGHFSLKVNKEAILVFSFLGYDRTELKITDSNQYNIQLVELDMDITGEIIIEKTPKRSLKKVKRQLVKNGTIERTNVGQFLYKLSSIFRRKK